MSEELPELAPPPHPTLKGLRPPVLFPVALVVDNREQMPYTFQGLKCDARQKRRPLGVQLIGGALNAGDYSLEGAENRLAVERKSLSDLFSTLGQARARFIRELERLQELEFAAVVVEAEWDTIINRPPEFSKLNPKTVYRSVVAWQQRYRNVHWWMCPGRRFAEITTFRVLERWWRDSGENQGATIAPVDNATETTEE